MSSARVEAQAQGEERPEKRPASRSPGFSDLAPSHRYAAMIVAVASGASVLVHFGLGARGLISVGFVAVLVGIGAALSSPVSHQVKTFQRDVPGIVDSANKSLSDVQSWLDRNHIGIKLQSQGQSALSTIERNVLRGSGSLVKFTTSLVTSVAKAAFGVILTIVISVYMLVYSDRIGRVVRSVMPPGF